MGDVTVKVNKKTRELILHHDNDYENHDKPKSGYYKIQYESTGMSVRAFLAETEVKIPESTIDVAKELIPISDIVSIFNAHNKKIYEDLNIALKVGVLLHGTAGSGKTSSLIAITKVISESFNNVLTIFVNNYSELRISVTAIKAIQKHFDDEYKFCIIMDECDYFMQDYETEVKSILDGLDSPSNTIFLAATNYIDQIPETIKSRPSRFKYVKDVSTLQDHGVIFSIINSFNKNLGNDYKLTDDHLRGMVENLIGFTLDECKTYFLEQVVNLQKAIHNEQVA